MDTKIADLIFIRGKGPISHIIENVEQSPYSHVAGLIKPNELYEAQAFRKTGYQGEDFYDGYSDVYTCDILTDIQRDKIIRFVLTKLGTKYDYEILGWELIHYYLHFDIPYHENNRYDCSELWNDAYKSVGVDLCPGLEYASPGDLSQSKLLRKIGSF